MNRKLAINFNFDTIKQALNIVPFKSTIKSLLKATVTQQKTNIQEKKKEKIKASQSIYVLRPNYKPTRNPVVLCHGLYGFDKIGFDNLPTLQVHYWQGVAEALEKMGSKVIVVKVSSTGSIAERAQQLHELLNKTLPGQQVNLLGHSMGGLDGRYLISRIPNEDKKYKVKSLTTISTPHRGSSFMDWCRDHLKVGKISSEEKIKDKHERQQWFERVMSYLDAPAYSHLTTDYCRNKFNPSTPDDPNVAYYSYNAYLDKMHYLSFLNFPWQIINQVEGKNDGLVSLKSGEWGQLVETVQANHFDLVVRFRWLTAIGRVIGYEDARYNINPSLSLPKTLLLSPETEFDNIEFYLRLSTFLHCKGF